MIKALLECCDERPPYHLQMWFQPCIKNKLLILVYCLCNQDIMGSSLQTKRRHLSDASVCMGSVFTEGRQGSCAAIF